VHTTAWGLRVSEPVEAYFSQLRDIRGSGAGVAEISYYGPLAALLDEVGKGLKPKVRALMQLRNTGSGNPDGGLFTATQLKGWEPGLDPLAGQLPSRGAIEVKGTADDAFAIAASEQVARYVDRYGLVLVTNLRDFVLVGRDVSGSGLRTLESCRLAETEAGFWAKVAQPRKFATDAGEGLTEFLRRVLLHNAPLTDPKDVAWFLASYARTARLRLEQKQELPALDALRGQLEDSLGLKFEGEKGDHFFRSTLVQTLFYGMFASWVLWARDLDHNVEIPWDRRFQWETATATLHVPMVYELFRQFADVHQLGALGIAEVLEWAEEVIWRIDRKSFFEKFREDHAVQYFYEPFLEAFDPQLRKELGVWYTPDEVVKYMVARVDTVLREELGIVDGLADPSVVVLDPCCGTGAYLVEVLRKIDETLQAKGADALTRQDVKRAAMDRVIGFEIMPAPFVVAHLQLGILLAELGVPLRDADERAAVYLTNALTGWGDGEVVPPKDKRVGPGQMHSTALFPEFAEERDAADRVKREEPVIVVLGNPPYNGFAGLAMDEERDLADAYRETKRAPKPVGRGLNDLYVRFFRTAERQIAERSGKGVVCFISNYSWLDGSSYTGMREHFDDEFSHVWIDNLNGDKFRTGKLTPTGEPDPSVFSTDANREGIGVGAAIATLCRDGHSLGRAEVKYREFWGRKKRENLLRALDRGDLAPYLRVEAIPALGLPFCPRDVDAGWTSWPTIEGLFAEWSPSIKTSRDMDLVSIDESTVRGKMEVYFNAAASEGDLLGAVPHLMSAGGRYDPAKTRSELISSGIGSGRFLDYAYRPWDTRVLYWHPQTKLLDEKRERLVRGAESAELFLVSRSRAERSREGLPLWLVEAVPDHHVIRPSGAAFPQYLAAGEGSLLGDETSRQNLSPLAQNYLASLGSGQSMDLMFHALAIATSPAYVDSNSDGLAQGWPRIPLPRTAAALGASIDLGRRVADFALMSRQSEPVAALRSMGGLSSVGGQPLDPAVDLGVTARWGVAGQGGVCMPSTGRHAERAYTNEERTGMALGGESLGLSAEQTIALLGDTCFDVYLNDVAYWRCVPSNVWRYTIGGYQVIKKWLSYRERALLGRDLKPEEARYVTEMVRRIAALVLMQPELDANYERVKADVWDWS